MTAARRISAPPGQTGTALIETLIAVPMVVWLGMAALQWALVMHARMALAYGLNEAARAGSVEHADPDAVDRGLARGLAPFLYGATDPGLLQANIARAQAHLTTGKGAGWIILRQLSPTDASFADWAEPALGADGQADGEQVEIPNDNLQYRMRASSPNGGIDGYRGEEPIGAASGQTLLDANLLKLELVYGVPMSVPFIGKLTAWVLAQVDGCDAPTARQVGLIDLGTPAVSARPWTCGFYQALDERGYLAPRMPVRVSATLRMQSGARFNNGASRRDAVVAGYSIGLGQFDPHAGMLGGDKPATGTGEDADTAADRMDGHADGFLSIGGQRLTLSLGACDSG